MDNNRVICLDRDGVINVDTGYVHSWDQWVWRHGAIEAIAALQEQYTLVIVTNQSGIGRGWFTESQYSKLMRQVEADFIQRTGKPFIQYQLLCAHAPEDQCDCRKPATGLWQQFLRCVPSVNTAQSWFLDDKLENMDFARQAGLHPIWINPQAAGVGVLYQGFKSLHAFTEWILNKDIPCQNDETPKVEPSYPDSYRQG